MFHTVHKMKGGSGSFGYTDLLQSLRRFESCYQASNFSLLEELLKKIEEEVVKVTNGRATLREKYKEYLI